jgi:hypothetical protein
MCIYQFIVDETAPTSLALIQKLQEKGSVERAAEGIYFVETENEKAVKEIADGREFEQAIIKAEAV